MQSIAGPGVRLEGYADVFRGWCRLGAARELSSMQPPPVAVAVSNILAVENQLSTHSNSIDTHQLDRLEGYADMFPRGRGSGAAGAGRVREPAVGSDVAAQLAGSP